MMNKILLLNLSLLNAGCTIDSKEIYLKPQVETVYGYEILEEHLVYKVLKKNDKCYHFYPYSYKVEGFSELVEVFCKK